MVSHFFLEHTLRSLVICHLSEAGEQIHLKQQILSLCEHLYEKGCNDQPSTTVYDIDISIKMLEYS